MAYTVSVCAALADHLLGIGGLPHLLDLLETVHLGKLNRLDSKKRQYANRGADSHSMCR